MELTLGKWPGLGPAMLGFLPGDIKPQEEISA